MFFYKSTIYKQPKIYPFSFFKNYKVALNGETYECNPKKSFFKMVKLQHIYAGKYIMEKIMS